MSAGRPARPLHALHLLLPALLAAGWPGAPAAAQDTPLFMLGAGPALPFGDTRDVAGAGFGAGASGVFPLAGRLGVEVTADYTRLSLEWDPALVALGIDPATFRSAGGFVEGGHHWAGTATLGLHMLLRAREHAVVPHLHAGAGVARTGTAELRTWLLGEIETYPGVLETALATQVGAGLDVRVGEGMGVFARVRYMVLFTDPVRRTMIPIQLGLSLQLERR